MNVLNAHAKEMTSMKETLMNKMRYLIENVPKKILKITSKAQVEIFLMKKKKKSRETFLIQQEKSIKNMDLR